MQVRPWGPSITPQAHHFNGDSDVEEKLKYDPLFQNSKITKTSRLQMEEIVLLFIQWDEYNDHPLISLLSHYYKI